MASRNRELQTYIRMYKEETGEKEIDMHKVALFCQQKGYAMPVPPKPIDILIRQLSDAAREEVKIDLVLGTPYRVNHAFENPNGQMSWIDIDEAPRKLMKKSLFKRRDGMLADGLLLTFDADHWNRIHPEEEPIQVPMDFGPDIEWKKNAPRGKVA